jgi:hypothetical protein
MRVFIQLRECGEIEHAVDEHIDRSAGVITIWPMDEFVAPFADA